MTYNEAIAYLGSARRFGMKLGLEAMRELARRLGDPQDQLRFIHIAGSNGKGSTAAFCEMGLRWAGHRTGLFTSPHLISIRERIQVNREPISERDFAAGMTAVREVVEEEPTFFELMTALALWHFLRAGVDWVIWETGLGGRLDSTNIVTPEVSILTTVSLEHTQYLGGTIEEIAREKAGIIKPGVPVVSSVTGPAAEVIAAECRRLGAPLHDVDAEMAPESTARHESGQAIRLKGKQVRVRMLGRHQARNAACACTALPLLKDGASLDAVMRSLSFATWPGRFEIVSESPLSVLDGAHNVEAADSLVENWRDLMVDRFSKRETRAHLLFGAVGDKDLSGMTRLLLPIAGRVSLVRLASERSADPASLARYFPGVPREILGSVADFRPDGNMPVLMTGSLFLVGEILARQLGVENELQLNERLERAPAAP